MLVPMNSPMDASSSAGSEGEMCVETEDEMDVKPGNDENAEMDDDQSSIDENNPLCFLLRDVVNGSENVLAEDGAAPSTSSDVVNGSENVLAEDGAAPSTSSSSSKRDLILVELEEELEKQLEEKATRNELSTINVKSLLKAVLTHKDVFKYVEFALDRTHKPPEYQLKLTRAKAKELIDSLPAMAPLLCLPSTPVKNSDINMLFEDDLPDDPEDDDDFIPPDEVMDEDDESFFTNGDDSSVVSLMSPPPVLLTDRSAASSPAPAPAFENMSHRTRSKFSLSATPLEMIERAFVPPDVTEDLYNPVSGNQDWLDFLNGLIQPIDPQSESAETRFRGSDTNGDNDDDTDPEYNVMSDEDLEAPDVEELRNDRTVKVTKKEMSELMSELAEYTQMLEGYNSDDENGEADEAIEDLINAQPLAGVADKPLTTFPEVQIPSDDDGIVDMINLIPVEQYLLIQQQLMQHTQLLLQTYLLSLGNPFVNAGTQEASKAYLVEIKARGDASPISMFSLSTLNSTFSVMQSYKCRVSSNVEYFWQWHRHALSSGKKYPHVPVHPHLMEVCLTSCAFPYPLLLPTGNFKPAGYSQKMPFSENIDRLICSALDDCVTNLKMNINTPSGLRVACDFIRSALLPDRQTDLIVRHVISKKKSPHHNLIKNYFLGRGLPTVEHFVTPVKSELLYKKHTLLIDTSWHLALYSVVDCIKNNASSRT